ncbi:MAG: DsbA family protein [Acidobacteriota bacterium]|nr:DsbA family protein [Acidobacteriota bacterium]MDE3146741.1 DsbA family protein [Acidobacteriota bacterium]
MTSFGLTYDYRCPFAKNIHLHVLTALKAGADFDVEFIPWTMSQGHRAPGAPDVWDDPGHDAALMALAASVSVRDEQPEHFLAAHEQLFRARHERAIRLATPSEIIDVLSPLGVDTDKVLADIGSRRPHRVIAESFRSMEAYEAFGVPTFIVGENATFVRYMEPPSDDALASARIIESLVTLMAEQPQLNEFKHTRVPR